MNTDFEFAMDVRVYMRISAKDEAAARALIDETMHDAPVRKTIYMEGAQNREPGAMIYLREMVLSDDPDIVNLDWESTP